MLTIIISEKNAFKLNSTTVFQNTNITSTLNPFGKSYVIISNYKHIQKSSNLQVPSVHVVAGRLELMVCRFESSPLLREEHPQYEESRTSLPAGIKCGHFQKHSFGKQ